MNSVYLPSDKPSAKYPYFPDPAFLVIWRNWGCVEPALIAEALDADVEDVRAIAERMGFDPNPTVNPAWKQRGFLTTIRCNWNLCEYDQIMTLTGMTEEQLEFTLREDDFMWAKMGRLKPAVDRPKLTMPLTAEQEKRLDEIGALARRVGIPDENAFDFLARYRGEPSEVKALPQQDRLRLLYSYFAIYGDTLVGDGSESFPDALLAEYANCGVNAIWFQGLFSQLAPNPWKEDTDKEGRERRLESLRKLVARAAKYGIGVYPYFNEPRPEYAEFFEEHPELRGGEYEIYNCLCPSVPEVLKYLEDTMEYIFTEVPGLAGYFSITYSENFTNCACRGRRPQSTCPRCAERSPADIMADVNNALARGAHRANPNARAMVYTWSWSGEWDASAVAQLCENQYVISVSEEHLKFKLGDTETGVMDYSMSKIGPSEYSLRRWKTGQEKGMPAVAKIQVNSSWELSAMPFVPIFGLIGEHLSNLRENDVRDIMLTWTLGGCPTPVASFACEFIDGDEPLEEALHSFLKREYGEAADVVYAAQDKFCEAFREYPFQIISIYNGPHTFGPMAPFFGEKSNCKSTMVGFPYDDLAGWRTVYPEDTYEEQWRLVVTGWKEGLDILDKAPAFDEKYQEFCTMARASYCHLASAYNHTRFVRARDAGNVEGMLAAIRDERPLVEETLALRTKDSRIGFEASNHYYFTVQDMVEKLINLDYLEAKYTAQ